MIESQTESAPLFLPIEKPLAIDVTRTKDQPPQRLHPTHLWATNKCDQCATKKNNGEKNMKTNYGMETDPSPQVWSTIGRRILWPTRLLNIGLIDGFEHSFNDWDVLTQEKLILWPFLAPPPSIK